MSPTRFSVPAPAFFRPRAPKPEAGHSDAALAEGRSVATIMTRPPSADSRTLGAGAARRIASVESAWMQVESGVDPSQIAFDANGLVPCVTQDWATGEVLTLAYMNRRRSARTLETGEIALLEPLPPGAVAQGRDLGQRAARALAALRLRRRRAAGPGRAGRPGLPHRRAHLLPPHARAQTAVATHEALPALARTLAERRRDMPDGSYTARLFRAGPDRIGREGRGGGRGGGARRPRGVRRAAALRGGRPALPPRRRARGARADLSPTRSRS